MPLSALSAFLLAHHTHWGSLFPLGSMLTSTRWNRADTYPMTYVVHSVHTPLVMKCLHSVYQVYFLSVKVCQMCYFSRRKHVSMLRFQLALQDFARRAYSTWDLCGSVFPFSSSFFLLSLFLFLPYPVLHSFSFMFSQNLGYHNVSRQVCVAGCRTFMSKHLPLACGRGDVNREWAQPPCHGLASPLQWKVAHPWRREQVFSRNDELSHETKASTLEQWMKFYTFNKV